MARHPAELPPRGRDQRLIRRMSWIRFLRLGALVLVVRPVLPAPAAPCSSSTSPRASSSRCRSRSASSMARPRRPSSAAATSPTWSAPTSIARGCSGRSIPARSSSRPSELQGLPRFADWRQINAEALVTGTVGAARPAATSRSSSGSGTCSPASRCAACASPPRPTTGAASRTRSPMRCIERITGEGAYFDSQIVYVSESGPATDRVKRARDHGPGRRQSPLPDRRRRLVLTPRFHPDGRGWPSWPTAAPCRRSICSN